MTDENEPTCCCGFIGVRKGSRIIANISLVLGAIFTVTTIYSLIVVIPNLFEEPRKIQQKSSNPTKSVSYLASELNICMNILTTIFVETIYIYVNFCLRKATFKKNIEYVRFWLVINGLGIIYFWIIIVLMATIIPQSIAMVIIQIAGSGINVYFLTVVYRFYQKLLEANKNAEKRMPNNRNEHQSIPTMPVSEP